MFIPPLIIHAADAPGLSSTELAREMKVPIRTAQEQLRLHRMTNLRGRITAGTAYVPGQQRFGGRSVFAARPGGMIHFDTTLLGVWVKRAMTIEVSICLFVDSLTRWATGAVLGGPHTVRMCFAAMERAVGPCEAILHDRRADCSELLSLIDPHVVRRRATPTGIAEFSNMRVEVANNVVKRKVMKTPRSDITDPTMLDTIVAAAIEERNNCGGKSSPAKWVAAMCGDNWPPSRALIEALVQDHCDYERLEPITFHGEKDASSNPWGYSVEREPTIYDARASFARANPDGFYWSVQDGFKE